MGKLTHGMSVATKPKTWKLGGWRKREKGLGEEWSLALLKAQHSRVIDHGKGEDLSACMAGHPCHLGCGFCSS